MRSLRQRIQFCTSPTDNVRIAYAKSGEGPPLVKAGNWTSHLELEKANPIWRHWIAEFSRDYTFIRYDPRGSGLSDRTVPEHTFDAWVQDLEIVVDAAGLKQFSLLGVSSGAAFAVAYAARHPERVSHLVLHNGFVRGPLRRLKSESQRDLYESMAKIVEHGWDTAAFRQMFTMQFIPDSKPEQQRAFDELLWASSSAQSAAQRLRMMDELDISDLAQKVACPTLVTHSIDEMRVPLEEGRILASLIPQAQFVSIKSRNHVLLEHEPAWREWLDEVRAFLPAAMEEGPVFDGLTRRERELVHLISQGLTNMEIADKLSLSPKTVKNHITSIFSKIEVESRAQLIVRAHGIGFRN